MYLQGSTRCSRSKERDVYAYFSRKAADFVKRLPKSHRTKLKQVAEDLMSNPFSHPYRKIRGETNLYRIRLGTFRLLFEVDDDHGQVVILNIDKRGRIYDR